MEIGGLFNLEKTMVSVVHKELEYEVEKLKYKKNEGHAAEDQNQIWTKPNQIQIQIQIKSELNHPGSVHMTFYSRWWINTFYHLLVKNN